MQTNINYYQKSNMLVFTDLDGTLLDHNSYNFDAALPAIRKLQIQHVPIIPNTSKTVAEMIVVNKILNNYHPFIAENGGVIGIPKGYFSDIRVSQVYDEYQLVLLGPAYYKVLETLAEIKNSEKYDFVGFNDMSIEQVSDFTDLNLQQAKNAKKRICSEPIIWKSPMKDLESFKDHLVKFNFQLTRGGRFWHVLGKYNKATAMQKLISIYKDNGYRIDTTIALGDSPNDIEMLNEAGTAVIIKGKDGNHLSSIENKNVIYSSHSGPEGWNETIFRAISEFKQNEQ